MISGGCSDIPATVKIDVLFPVLHGPWGEDGTVQGVAELARVPYVGAGVCSSAAAMDKDVTKRLLRDAKIPVSKFVTARKSSAPHRTQKLRESWESRSL